ncbi:MAG: helix-turn-helix domain-containing protein [Micropruina sp.]|uniref:helix-turn-helix domain-containing protein n=1 Tax=Micropruina sp. TaxID=2737536 RepID=UPI0039E657F4
MRNDAVRETLLADVALRSIAKLLPASWSIRRRDEVASGGAPRDTLIELHGPAGGKITFLTNAQRSGTMSNELLLLALRTRLLSRGWPVLFLSDYIGPSLRAALTEAGISYADATGWVRLATDSPLILLTSEGAKRSPRTPGSKAVVRLNGLAACRIIRALSTTSLPIGVRDLAGRAEVSPGSVSKLLTTLAREGVVDRDDRGVVTAVRRRALIQRWVRDYNFTKTNASVGYWIAPRGLERTLTNLERTGAVALTGSAAARRLLPDGATPVVPLRLLALYTAVPDVLARSLGLIEADPVTANVVIAVPQDSQILPKADGPPVSIAPVALVLADLLTLPNRSDAEAEQLMDSLQRSDPAWKA